jgi:hypothetical protein
VSVGALVSILNFGTNNPNITVQDCDLGWTTADNTGNSAYGIRANSQADNLTIRRNWIHDTGSDGIQGTGGSNVTIDRNEIGPVGQTPGSSEHSDLIQVTSNDPGPEHHQQLLPRPGLLRRGLRLRAERDGWLHLHPRRQRQRGERDGADGQQHVQALRRADGSLRPRVRRQQPDGRHGHQQHVL